MYKYRLSAFAMTTVLSIASSGAAAAELEKDRFYVGGGISDNEIDNDSDTGYQFLVGYELPVDTGEVDTALEVGYWDAGDVEVNTPAGRRGRDVDGIWASGVFSFEIAPRVKLLGRAGMDFGDDDGPMAGAGVGFDLGRRFELRGEYVAREDTDSVQANLLYRF